MPLNSKSSHNKLAIYTTILSHLAVRLPEAWRFYFRPKVRGSPNFSGLRLKLWILFAGRFYFLSTHIGVP